VYQLIQTGLVHFNCMFSHSAADAFVCLSLVPLLDEALASVIITGIGQVAWNKAPEQGVFLLGWLLLNLLLNHVPDTPPCHSHTGSVMASCTSFSDMAPHWCD
jgi:hypothetical protein